jgi:hypothetical protein
MKTINDIIGICDNIKLHIPNVLKIYCKIVYSVHFKIKYKFLIVTDIITSTIKEQLGALTLMYSNTIVDTIGMYFDDKILNIDDYILLYDKTDHYTSYFNILDVFYLEQNQLYTILFDIDGVVCSSLHWKVEKTLSKEEWFKAKEVNVCDPTFIKTVQMLHHSNKPYYFVTGRKEESKKVTYSMFDKANLGFCKSRIFFHPDDLSWDVDVYINRKVEIAKYHKNLFQKVYMIDDSLPTIQALLKLNDPNIIPVYYSLPNLEP